MLKINLVDMLKRECNISKSGVYIGIFFKIYLIDVLN